MHIHRFASLFYLSTTSQTAHLSEHIWASMSMQATSGSPLGPSQPSASGQPASQAAQAQADAEEQLAQSQSLNIALRRRPFIGKHITASTPIPPAPILKPLTPIEHFRSDAHPADPFRTQHQRRMMDAFIAHQRWGLRGEILEEARRRQSQGTGSKKSSWNAIIEDEEENDTCYTFQLLMQLPDCIIKSLIRNTLAYDYAKDKDVKAFVNRHMKTHTPYAGIYVNIPTRAPPPGGLALSGMTGEGEFLSFDEVELLIKRVERYIANKPADYAENSKVDYFFKASKPGTDLSERRFGPGNSRSNARWQEWLDELRSIYCKNVPVSERSTPFRRCPMEVGWSQDIPKRLKDHIGNGSTTAIFGVVNAMTRQPTTQEGFAFPGPWQLALFSVWKRDIDLARVAEAVGSILCSSYWCYGGLNILEAGYSNITKSTPGFEDILWEESIREAWGRIEEYGLADEERQFWLDEDRMVEARQESPQSKNDATEAKLESAKASAKLAFIRSKLQRVHDEREQMELEIKTQRAKIEYQKGRKSHGQEQLEKSVQQLDELRRETVQREKEFAPLLDLDFEDESTLSQGTKAYLGRLDANLQKDKDAWIKKREAEKTKQSSATIQVDATQYGSQG